MCKTNVCKTLKIYLQVITDLCVKIVNSETCFEKKSKSSVVGTFKNIFAVGVHCWYIRYGFAGFCLQIFEKKLFQKTF